MRGFACCNELFESWPWSRTLSLLAELGYRGIELAPFTLAANPVDLRSWDWGALRHQVEFYGLEVVGLHWLLAKTQGLHLTSADPEVRRATAEHLGRLAELCRTLGGALMVLGSPQQRSLPAGMTLDEGMAHAVDTLTQALPALEAMEVDLCLEALGPSETNFVNTMTQAEELMQRVNHPRIRLHLDVKAMASEATPMAELIQRYASKAGHFHANDPNRRGPGFGACDFHPIFTALAKAGYSGWISVEVFDYSPDPATIARESLTYMQQCWPAE